MHLVVKGHLKTFRAKYPNNYKEDTLFEAFINYISLRQFSSDAVEPEDLIFEGDDPGIDGVAIVVGDALISTKDELDAALDGRTKDIDVNVIFTQAKTSERWNKQEIATFNVAIQDFLNENPKFPLSDKLKEQHEVFFGLFNYIGVISGGRPNAYSYFATTDRSPTAPELLAARDNIRTTLEDSGYFNTCESVLLDRDAINQMWLSAGGAVEAKLSVIGSAAFPSAPGIDASYVATVSAKEFIEKILTDDKGSLRQRIFDENVRDYIGSDNDVNNEIAETICDPEKQRRFGVMNNGVTIVSPDVRLQGTEIFLRDFQIINGCQTSNVLFEQREHVGDEANLMMKIVHAKDPTFVEDIVRSTNRQSKVQDEQFLAVLETLKGIEKYFEARDEGDDQKLYFERRKNQYSGRGIPNIRIFDVKQLARCVGAMFIERPDLASRYPNRLTGEMSDLIFSPEYKEEIFYVSALAYYRVFLLFSNQRIDPRFSNLKWHLLMAIKVYLDDGEGKFLNSRKIGRLCDKIEKFVTSNDPSEIGVMNRLCEEISNNEKLSRDQLRNQSLLVTMRTAAQSLKP